MNNHADIRKQLAAYCGGDLEPAERVRLEEHLVGCASCRAELADLEIALHLVRTIPESEPPPWLATRIMARVREQQRQKRSWVQRIFFPLHVKLPIEVAALLAVCVTGYYMARNVETELKQPAIQQELPAAPLQTGRPAGVPREEVPAGAPPTPAPPSPAAKRALRSEENMPAQPSAPKAADQVTPQLVPETPGKSSPLPAFAPAPPIMKEERGSPVVESPYGDTLPSLPGLGESSFKRAKKGAAKMKEKGLGTGEQEAMKSEEARSDSEARAGAALPQVRIRLIMISPASAPGSVKEAVTRSGGSVISDTLTEPNTLKARIPSVRMGDLLERLGRLGSFVERPQTRDLPGVVEMEISW